MFAAAITPNFITRESWKGIDGPWEFNFEEDGYAEVFESESTKHLLSHQPIVEKDRGLTVMTIPGGLSLEILKKIGEKMG
jgi:hypothetical protein